MSTQTPFWLALTGSPSSGEALLFTPAGDFVGFTETAGLYLRDEPMQLMSAIEPIPGRLSQASGFTTVEVSEQVERLSMAVSGTDQRFYNDFHRGLLRRGGFPNLDEGSAHFHGLAEASYRAIRGDLPGLIIRAGIGCSMFATDGAGRSSLSSAFTTIMGAPGSSYTIGLSAFHLVKKVYDELASEEEERIAKRVLAALGMSDPLEVLEEIQQLRRSEGDVTILLSLGALSGPVFTEAAENNPAANDILDSVSNYHLAMARRIIRRLGLAKASFPLIFDGSLFRDHPAMARRIFEKLGAEFPRIAYLSLNNTYYSRVVGAIKLCFCPHPAPFSDERAGEALDRLLGGARHEVLDRLIWKPIEIRSIADDGTRLF